MTNSKNIDIFYDLIDEAVMLVYNETNLSYLESLVRVLDGLVDSFNDQGISVDTVKLIDEIYDRVSKTMFLNEEIRIAFSLLAIKGLKDTSYRLDIVTPDSLNFIIANIVNHFSNDGDVLLDITMGIGNLLSTIHNFSSNKLKIVGVEKEAILSEVARVGFNINEIESMIYCNDPVDANNLSPNIVIGDLDNLNNNEYKIVLNQVESLEEDGLFVFLIKNDFFTSINIKDFKEKFNGTFLGLIILPDSMFKDSTNKKSILIGTKKKIDEQMLIVNMPSLSEEDKVINTIKTINEMIDKLKGMIR